MTGGTGDGANMLENRLSAKLVMDYVEVSQTSKKADCMLEVCNVVVLVIDVPIKCRSCKELLAVDNVLEIEVKQGQNPLLEK
jgi:hypothetical protein